MVLEVMPVMRPQVPQFPWQPGSSPGSRVIIGREQAGLGSISVGNGSERKQEPLLKFR